MNTICVRHRHNRWEQRDHCVGKKFGKSQRDWMTDATWQQNNSNLHTTEDETWLHGRGQLRIYPWVQRVPAGHQKISALANLSTGGTMHPWPTKALCSQEEQGATSSIATENEMRRDDWGQCRMHPGFEIWQGSWNCCSVRKWNYWQQGKKLQAPSALLQATFFVQVFTFSSRFSQKRKTLWVLTKNWPKFKNCTKLGTHPPFRLMVKLKNTAAGVHSPMKLQFPP